MKKRGRADLVLEVMRAGRENGAASIMYHTAVGELLGLSPSDHKTLDILTRKGALTAGDLANETGLATASVTSLIDRLEEQKLVRRVRDSEDRRKVYVQLEEGSTGDLHTVVQHFVQSLRTLVSSYKETELHTILNFLEDLTEVFRKETERLRKRSK